MWNLVQYLKLFFLILPDNFIKSMEVLPLKFFSGTLPDGLLFLTPLFWLEKSNKRIFIITHLTKNRMKYVKEPNNLTCRNKHERLVLISLPHGYSLIKRPLATTTRKTDCSLKSPWSRCLSIQFLEAKGFRWQTSCTAHY